MANTQLRYFAIDRTDTKNYYVNQVWNSNNEAVYCTEIPMRYPQQPSAKTVTTAREFPSVSRFFPDMALFSQPLTWKIFGASFLSGILLMSILLQIWKISRSYQILQLMQSEKQMLQHELSSWQTFTTAHPDYRDGYYQLALLDKQLGRRNEAIQNAEKAYQLDRNFTQAINILATMK